MAALIVVLLVVHVGFWRPWSPKELYIKSIEFGEENRVAFGDFRETNEQVTVVSSRHGPDVQVSVLDATVDEVPCRTCLLMANRMPPPPLVRTEIWRIK